LATSEEEAGKGNGLSGRAPDDSSHSVVASTGPAAGGSARRRPCGRVLHLSPPVGRCGTQGRESDTEEGRGGRGRAPVFQSSGAPGAIDTRRPRTEAGALGGREKLDIEEGAVAERLRVVRLQIARTKLAAEQPSGSNLQNKSHESD